MPFLDALDRVGSVADSDSSRDTIVATFNKKNLNASLGVPLHRQIFLVMKEAILSGNYEDGALLPGEQDLSRSFDVSRATMRRALSDLQSEGLIEKRHGRGTFVKKAARNETPSLHESTFFNQLREAGKMKVKVLEFEYLVPPPQVRAELKLAANQVAQRAVRLRFLGNQPVLHLTTYVPEHIGRTYTRTDLGQKPLYDLIQRSGAPYTKAVQTIEATLAAPSVATVLKLETGTPLLHIKRCVFDKDGNPVEYLSALGVSDFNKIRMILGDEGERDSVNWKVTYYQSGG